MSSSPEANYFVMLNTHFSSEGGAASTKVSSFSIVKDVMAHWLSRLLSN